jgi:parvulin-like peptidyl-prolyl isomerase
VSPTPSPTPTITPTPAITATASPSPFPTLPPTPTPNATQRADTFKTNRDTYFADLRRQTGMSDADINAYFEAQAIRDALRDSVATDVGKTGTFVDARHILVDSEELAKDLLKDLEAGEPFSDLAKAVSKDTGSGAKGGELGWSPVSNFVKEFADATKTGEIGNLLGPIKTQFGYHIIQVRAREERDLTEEQITTGKNSAFDAWFKDLKEKEKDKIQKFSETWINFVPSDPASPFG